MYRKVLEFNYQSDEIVNLAEVRPTSSRKKNHLTKSNFLTLLFIVFTMCFNQCNGFLVRDKFLFCEIHGNRAIWHLPDSCLYKTDLTAQPDQFYEVLVKDDMVIRGKGWMCNQKRTLINTYMDLLGTKTHEEITFNKELSREDCTEMVRTKKCCAGELHDLQRELLRIQTTTIIRLTGLLLVTSRKSYVRSL